MAHRGVQFFWTKRGISLRRHFFNHFFAKTLFLRIDGFGVAMFQFPRVPIWRVSKWPGIQQPATHAQRLSQLCYDTWVHRLLNLSWMSVQFEFATWHWKGYCNKTWEKMVGHLFHPFSWSLVGYFWHFIHRPSCRLNIAGSFSFQERYKKDEDAIEAGLGAR